MKLSDVIKAIKEEMEVYGDAHVLSYKYTHLHATSESWKWSPTRKNKHGHRMKMNQKEFKEWCEKQTDAR